MKTDPRVDAYIAKAAPFARPLLTEVRKRIQQACPEATETIKWNVPFYVQNGKLIASMAAFKQHTKFGVWQDMRPVMVDARTPADLPAAAEHAKKLKAAAAHASGAAAAAKQKPSAKAAAAKKSAVKKGSTKPTAAKSAAAKKSAAKAIAKQPSRKKSAIRK